MLTSSVFFRLRSILLLWSLVALKPTPSDAPRRLETPQVKAATAVN
jgi:hypothetical protein